ncbi:MAG: hypothetical protein AAF742_07950 [Pseudomonadota bacterium]
MDFVAGFPNRPLEDMVCGKYLPDLAKVLILTLERKRGRPARNLESLNLARTLSSSSEIPSEKYSWLPSGLMSTKGKTAIEESIVVASVASWLDGTARLQKWARMA